VIGASRLTGASNKQISGDDNEKRNRLPPLLFGLSDGGKLQ
jgi:hypothetical protein